MSPVLVPAGHPGSLGPSRHQGPPRRTGKCPSPPSLHLCPGSWCGLAATQGEMWEGDNAGAEGTASHVGRALAGGLGLCAESKAPASVFSLVTWE